MVELPPELTVTNKDKLTRQCHRYQEGWITGFAFYYLQCRYDENTNKVQILNGFKTNSSKEDPPILQWAIPGISNPRALITTGVFNVSIYDRSKKLLYYYNITDEPTVSMTAYRTPNSINYTRTTSENGKRSDYIWRIVASNYLTEGDQFVWTMPHPIVFSKNSTITTSSYWL